MINIGIVGIGFLGMIHYLACQRLNRVRVRAICEQDPVRLAGDWRAIRGSFGPQGRIMDLTGVSRYTRLAEMLRDPRLDVIDICLPPAAHAEAAIAALRAGKHVFCEKPIALQVGDAERVVAAARRAGRLLLVGHVLPFFPEYRFLYHTVATARFGRLLGGSFKRLMADPRWAPDFFDPQATGGPMIDLNIHDAHFVRLLCGQPRAVQTVGRLRGTVPEWFQSQFLFDDPSLAITVTGGVIRQQGRPFTHGYEVYLERATIVFDFATWGKRPVVATPVTVLTDNGRVLRPKLATSDPVEAFVAELNEVVRSIRSQEPSKALDPELARDALLLCHRQAQSLIRRRAVRV